MRSDLLPLTTFEQFLLWEDRPAYPWSCFLRLCFAGGLERERLTRAIGTALERHPLLAARVVHRGRQLCWDLNGDGPASVTWATGESVREATATHLDLRQEVGSRFRVEHDPLGQRTELVIQFHHACCDGVGIMQFVLDLLVAFHFDEEPDGKRQLVALAENRLGLRGRTGLTAWRLARMAPQQALGLIGAKEFLTRAPVPLVPTRAAPAEASVPVGYPTTAAVHFSQAETERLVEKARRLAVTLNDVMVRELLLALFEFRATQTNGSDKDWLRLMIPMNIRSAFHRGIPASNGVSSVFIDRQPRDSADPKQLLDGIHNQMELIKRNRLGLTFLFSLGVCNWLPGGLKKQTRQDKCSISCIFSNLGRVLAEAPLPRDESRLITGNAMLQAMEVTVPNRPYNCVSFASLTYAQRLSVTMHFDPRVLSRAQGNDLLNAFVQHLKTTE